MEVSWVAGTLKTQSITAPPARPRGRVGITTSQTSGRPGGSVTLKGHLTATAPTVKTMRGLGQGSEGSVEMQGTPEGVGLRAGPPSMGSGAATVLVTCPGPRGARRADARMPAVLDSCIETEGFTAREALAEDTGRRAWRIGVTFRRQTGRRRGQRLVFATIP